MKAFKSIKINRLSIPNRIVRSATFEGMADEKGFPDKNYYKYYKKLVASKIGLIISGSTYISKQGKAMHSGQAGIDSSDKIKHYKKVTDLFKKTKSRIFMQIAHTGRQTRSEATGLDLVGVSNKKSLYFSERPEELNISGIKDIIKNFADSALYAKRAAFNGIQLHAAHGYLIHQFIHPAINNRKDRYGINKKLKIGIKFFEEVILAIRKKCGFSYPLIIKTSASDDLFPSFSRKQFTNLIKFLDKIKIDAIEVSYGTMDFPINIFRGKFPVKLFKKNNSIYKNLSAYKKFFWNTLLLPFVKIKFKKFMPLYNLKYAALAKQYTNIPIISVGGFRSGREISTKLNRNHADMISLCRPILCETDFFKKFKQNTNYISKCTNCNYCALNCDTNNYTHCIQEKIK